jgi:PIN domain nuclease of toxin-antitoxin system
VLIDTSVFLWWCLNDSRLSATAREIIAAADTVPHLSVISAWEIVVKSAAGKLELPGDAASWIPDRLTHYGMISLQVTLPHALAAGQLPLHHRDPFDRMLVAQSLVERIPIITSDVEIHRYDAEVIW